jgi:hypothetical protein
MMNAEGVGELREHFPELLQSLADHGETELRVEAKLGLKLANALGIKRQVALFS